MTNTIAMPDRIGYQGELGSNSEVAAQRLANAYGIKTPDYLGLVSSIHVIQSLEQGFCDYGVVAIKNSFAGTVSETAAALDGASVEVLDHYILPVVHCLFKLPDIADKDLVAVASHPQGLAQTRGSRNTIIPGLQEIETPDTAISARWLKSGQLKPTTAVVCSKAAGELHGLELIAEGIQDASDNCTEFVLLRAV